MIKSTHEWLCRKQKWYRKWHQFSWHPAAHMGLLVVAIGLIAAQAFSPSGTSVQAASLTVCDSGCSYTTIQAAINAATSGDTISVTQNKTYNETLNLGNKNLVLDGTNVATLTDTSRTGLAGILQINYGQNASTIIRNFTIVGSASTPEYGIEIGSSSSPIIQGNTFRNMVQNAVFISTGGSGGAILRNNTFYNNGTGISSGGRATIDSNRFYSNSMGISSSPDDDLIVVNNLFYENTGVSLSIQEAGTGYALHTIVNNTFYKSSGSEDQIFFYDGDEDGYAMQVFLKNNIIDGSSTALVLNYENGDEITLISDHNLFTSGNDNLIELRTGGPNEPLQYELDEWQASAFGNITDGAGGPDGNSISISPGFTNAAGNDFSLVNNSPAIGAGTDDIMATNDLATYSATLDFSDNTRPATVGSVATSVDMGAIENQIMGDPNTLIVSVPSALDTATPQGQATATAEYTAGPNQNVTTLVNWASSNPAKIYITDNGTVYGQGTGSAGVSATFGSLTSNTASVTTSGLPDYVSIYVDADNGNDTTGDGSETAPLKTLTVAAGYFLPGGRAFLKGTFTENIELDDTYSGTAENDTWFTNWPGYTATIAKIGSTAEITINGASYITIQGLNITGASGGEIPSGVIVTGGADNITLSDNVIYGNTFGITDYGSGTQNTNITISNNIIRENESANILLLDSDTIAIVNNVLYESGIGVGFLGENDGVSIWNNTLVGHGWGIAAFDFVAQGAPTITNTIFKNNIFNGVIYEDGEDPGIPVKMTSAVKTGTGNSFDYNVYYSEPGTPLVIVDSTPYTMFSPWQAASTHDDNSVSGDPLFINPDEDDYTIDESSPAYGIGISTGAPAGTATDVTGSVTRVAPFDIGAYAVDRRPPAATNLAASGLTSSAFILSWTDNASGLEQETSTVVKYSTTSATADFNTTVSTLNPDVVTLAVTGLTADTQYWFRVDGINSFGTTNSAALAVHTQAAGSSTSVTPPVVTPPTCSETRLSSFSSFTAIKNFVEIVKQNKVRVTLQDYLDYLDFNCDGEFDLRDFVEFMRR